MSQQLATVPRANFMFLHAARLQAHYAAQWLARAARAYVPAQADDRHTNLGWDDAFGGLVTHPLPDGSRLGLRIADLTLAFLDVHPHALALDGRAEAEVRTWLGGHIAGAQSRRGQARRAVALRRSRSMRSRSARAIRSTSSAMRSARSPAVERERHAALAAVQQRLAGEAS